MSPSVIIFLLLNAYHALIRCQNITCFDNCDYRCSNILECGSDFRYQCGTNCRLKCDNGSCVSSFVSPYSVDGQNIDINVNCGLNSCNGIFIDCIGTHQCTLNCNEPNSCINAKINCLSGRCNCNNCPPNVILSHSIPPTKKTISPTVIPTVIPTKMTIIPTMQTSMKENKIINNTLDLKDILLIIMGGIILVLIFIIVYILFRCTQIIKSNNDQSATYPPNVLPVQSSSNTQDFSNTVPPLQNVNVLELNKLKSRLNELEQRMDNPEGDTNHIHRKITESDKKADDIEELYDGNSQTTHQKDTIGQV